MVCSFRCGMAVLLLEVASEWTGPLTQPRTSATLSHGERETLVLYRKRIREGMYVNTVLWRAFVKAV